MFNQTSRVLYYVTIIMKKLVGLETYFQCYCKWLCTQFIVNINPWSAGYGIYTTWKHVPPKRNHKWVIKSYKGQQSSKFQGGNQPTRTPWTVMRHENRGVNMGVINIRFILLYLYIAVALVTRDHETKKWGEVKGQIAGVWYITRLKHLFKREHRKFFSSSK